MRTCSRLSTCDSLKPLLAVLALALSACEARERHGPNGWAGTIDTLSSGQVVMRNPESPLWRSGEEWRITEELRIGGVEGAGPEIFGRIASLEMDQAGRIWALEHQAQELRVFDAFGQHVRTVGRRGEGPGEFQQAVHIALAPDGNMWVMDPRNARLSIFDTAGVYLAAKRAAAGFVMLPWPGRFDVTGRYHAPVPGSGSVRIVRFDSAFQSLDTLQIPVDPVTRDGFELRDAQGRLRIRADVPYQGFLVWRIAPMGTIWAMVTDEYRLFELDTAGDTLRTITRRFTPIPVTAADRERAREDMKWFTDQGGRIDMSMLPSSKPPTRGFFFDDERHIWVERTTDGDDAHPVFDLFDPEGRYLGAIRLPFALAGVPVVRDRRLYAVTRDELDVPYIVRARIDRP